MIKPRPIPPTPKPAPDITVENHGSIFLFRPHTPEAEAWIKEHTPDDAQFFGDALVVEHRYARDIADAMTAHGLVLE